MTCTFFKFAEKLLRKNCCGKIVAEKLLRKNYCGKIFAEK